MPGVFTSNCDFFAPDQIEARWQLRDDQKLLCNVGSVGQPRDEDPRACYCLFDGDLIQFRRVEYDVEATVRKMNDLFPE